MKKIALSIIGVIAHLICFSQEVSDTTIICTSAIVSIHISDTIPFVSHPSIIDSNQVSDCCRYQVYKMVVDSVIMINVAPDFQDVFTENYLKSCEFLVVFLNYAGIYEPRTIWDSRCSYWISADVGMGKNDLFLYSVIDVANYSPDDQCFKTCSFFEYSGEEGCSFLYLDNPK